MKKSLSAVVLNYLTLALLLGTSTLLPGLANAQTRLSVQGSGKLYPIAIPQVCVQSGDFNIGKEVSDVIARDLDLSGYFDVLNPSVYIETPGKCISDPSGVAYSDWTVLGTEGLVKGDITQSGNSFTARMYLHDVSLKKIVLGKEYSGDLTQVRKIAHRFANEILMFFTGELGVFGSQVAYSGKVGRFKELFLMDMDGSNIRQITDDKGLALSIGWHPSGEALIYTNYKKREPNLYIKQLNTRQDKQLTFGPEMDTGGRFLLMAVVLFMLSHVREILI